MIFCVNFSPDEMGANGVANIKMSEHQIEGDLPLNDDILHETTGEKIFTTVGTILLLLTLVFLWVWYR